jgi:hypothetical protein
LKSTIDASGLRTMEGSRRNEMEEVAMANSVSPGLRPFYFIVVLWGERFRDYFLDFCLPSLLSPNNIPALDTRRGSKFLICSTPEDWSAMERTAIFGVLKRYVEPVLVEIPLPEPGRSGCEHMGIGHKKAMDLAFRNKAYGVLVTPDYMMSDGSIAALERHAASGKRLVLVAALRFGEEPLFENLASLGVIEPGRRLSAQGAPLVVSGRQLVAAGIRSFHSEVIRYGWESPCFSDFPAACWWPVPGGDGIVVHSMSWGALLMDYASLDDHDTTCLEKWTFDGDYLYNNFGTRMSDIHVVTDSDEIMQASWAPLSDRALPLDRIPSRNGFWGEMVKGGILRNTVLSKVFDPLKRRLLFVPVCWHSRPLSPAWQDAERKTRKTLRRYLFDVEASLSEAGGEGSAGVHFLLMHVRRVGVEALAGLLRVIGFVIRAVGVTLEQFRYTDRMIAVAKRALRGDVVAWKRIFRRIRVFGRIVRAMPVEND